ncbi:MAG TPA: hypothetical protein P5318_19325 [Candidatus Hydrogenedentes bacterium]|nr:hypothetical protein [Candidatus Hydrogenedentota bacterium]
MSNENPPRLIPLSRWNNYHPWPPQGGLRHLVFHARENGFDAVIRRAGRRILIDESEFFAWIDRQNKDGENG